MAITAARTPLRLATALAAMTVLAAVLTGPAAAAQSRPAVPATPAPAGPKPGSVAAAAAQAKLSGRPAEVTSAATATQRILANPDGTTTLQLNPLPVRTKRGGGSWTDLDATLRRNPDRSFSPAVSASGLVLSGGGSGPLATMTNAGTRLAISWPAPLPAPAVSGNTATYNNVLSGVDLVVTATEQGGFSHILVVHDASAAANPALATLRLTTAATGVTLAADQAGNVTATDNVNQVRFAAPSALMWDTPTSGAATKPAGAAADSAHISLTEPADGASTAPVAVTIAGNTVILTPDHNMLTATSTRWPVIIDPSWNPNWTSSGPSAWTYVDSHRHDVKYYNVNDYARAGYQGHEIPYFTARSFFQFPVPSFLWGTDIVNATLQAKEVWSASTDAFYVDVNLVCPIGAGTDWDHQPCKGRLIDRQSTPGNWRADRSDNPMQVEWNVTGALIEAAAAHWSTDTLGLYNEDETNKWSWRRFYNNPTLAIQFNNPPNTPTNPVTSPAVPCAGGLIGSTAVTLSATVSDPDGSQGQVEADFTVTDATTNTTLATPALNVSNQQTASVTLPANRFTNSHTYTWAVRANDGRSVSQATSTCRFTIDQTQPDPPTVSSTTYPQGQTGPPARTPATFTFTPPTNRTEDPASYVYSLNTPPPATLPHGPTLFPTAVFVPAQPGGAGTTVTITPRRADTNILYVYAIDAAGNPSATTTYPFHTAAITTPDLAGDLTGDGVPDALAVGTTSLPGLWLYAGTDRTGRVNPAMQISAAGTGGPGATNTPTDWTGATVTTADFTADGIQDVLVRLSRSDSTGNVEVLPGLGDGTTAAPDPATIKPLYLPKVDNIPGSQSVDQIVAAPGPSVTGLALPDLYAIVGDTLYFYTPLLPPATAYDNPQPVSAGWTKRTITATAVGDTPAL
jgi:hypothetical protein